MRSIVLAVAAGVLAACATQPPPPPPKPFVVTRWEWMQELPTPGMERPYVRFGDGRLEGYGGCNRFDARYVQDSVGASEIAIGRIDHSVRATCPRTAQEAEERMIQVLQAASSYSITGDIMIMTGSAGTISFRAAKEGAAR